MEMSSPSKIITGDRFSKTNGFRNHGFAFRNSQVCVASAHPMLNRPQACGNPAYFDLTRQTHPPAIQYPPVTGFIDSYSFLGGKMARRELAFIVMLVGFWWNPLHAAEK